MIIHDFNNNTTTSYDTSSLEHLPTVLKLRALHYLEVFHNIDPCPDQLERYNRYLGIKEAIRTQTINYKTYRRIYGHYPKYTEYRLWLDDLTAGH